ncbi:MAG TPA: TetR/AcrR family transcriptional regulator [Ignavibacteria bacterium]|nr:TetR/AcrR family transcriptional regulator [Ignavibacteria bacterium]
MPRTKEQLQEIRDKTEKVILYTALELFAEKGFKGTTISDIAAKAGISKGLAYNYFSSKKNLLEAVYETLLTELDKIFKPIEQIKDPYQKIKILIDVIFTQIEKEEKFWRLYMDFSLHPGVKGIVNKITADFLDTGFKLLEKIFRKIGIKNPANESKLFGAILDGMIFHYIFNKEYYPLKRMKRFLQKKYNKESLEKLK